MTNFIKSWDDAFSPEECQRYIDFFQFSEESGIAYNRLATEGRGAKDKKDVAADNAMAYDWGGEARVKVTSLGNLFMQRVMNGYLNEYRNEFPITGGLLHDGMKVQKTLPSGGYHIWHCENEDGLHKRVLAYSVYLNDVDEGGETEFLHQSVRFKPKQGQLLMWPAAFTHLHRGNPPLSGEKYILTGWIVYQ